MDQQLRWNLMSCGPLALLTAFAANEVLIAAIVAICVSVFFSVWTEGKGKLRLFGGEFKATATFLTCAAQLLFLLVAIGSVPKHKLSEEGRATRVFLLSAVMAVVFAVVWLHPMSDFVLTLCVVACYLLSTLWLHRSKVLAKDTWYALGALLTTFVIGSQFVDNQSTLWAVWRAAAAIALYYVMRDSGLVSTK